MDILNWGIIGTGNIANQFARGLAALPDARLVAVGSRRKETAVSFANKHQVPKGYDSYEAVANDPAVQAVYIATPHHLHMENTLMALEAGKAVLCEKPFAINASQATRMINSAREKKLFLMEAMWSRFLPTLTTVRELINDSIIGEVRMITADFGFRSEVDPQSRLFNPAVGGGALLDVGIYPISLASMIFGKPRTIQSAAHIGKTGVDEQAGILLEYERGQLAMLHTAIRTDTPREAQIFGTKGNIKLHSEWFFGTKLTLTVDGNAPQLIDKPYVGNGYSHEAAEVRRCLRRGKLESDIMPLDESLQIIETLDAIRAQWGLTYPMER